MKILCLNQLRINLKCKKIHTRAVFHPFLRYCSGCFAVVPQWAAVIKAKLNRYLLDLEEVQAGDGYISQAQTIATLGKAGSCLRAESLKDPLSADGVCLPARDN